MKNLILSRILFAFSCFYFPFILAMEEDTEKISKSKPDDNPKTERNNPFGFTNLLDPDNIIGPEGKFNLPFISKKKLKQESLNQLKTEIKLYIDGVADGSLKTKLWKAYFSEDEFASSRKLFGDKKDKIHIYFGKYFTDGVFLPFVPREDGKGDNNKTILGIDSIIFKPENIPFLKILRPLFEAVAFYEQEDPRFNCLGMHYLGRINEILSQSAKSDKEKKDLVTKACNWYMMAIVIGRATEFQEPFYFKIYHATKENKSLENALRMGNKKAFDEAFIKAKEKHALLKDNKSYLFYLLPLKRLSELDFDQKIEFLKFYKEVDSSYSSNQKELEDLQQPFKKSKEVKSIPDFDAYRLDSTDSVASLLVEYFRDNNQPMPIVCDKSILFVTLRALATTPLDLPNEQKEAMGQSAKSIESWCCGRISENLNKIGKWGQSLSFAKDLATKMNFAVSFVQDAVEKVSFSMDTRDFVVIISEIDRLLSQEELRNGVSGDLIFQYFDRTACYFLINSDFKRKKALELALIRVHFASVFANEKQKTITRQEIYNIENAIIILNEYDAINSFRRKLNLNEIAPQATAGELLKNADDGLTGIVLYGADEDISNLKKEREEMEEIIDAVILKESQLIQLENEKKNNKNDDYNTDSTPMRGENLSRYRSLKREIKNTEKEFDEIDKEHRENFENGKKIESTSTEDNWTIDNIRENLESLNNHTKIEKKYLSFNDNAPSRYLVKEVIKDINLWKEKLIGLGNPKIVGKKNQYLRRKIGKAGRIVYSITKEGAPHIEEFFDNSSKGHDAYEEFINK